jgi:hypothetical protein
MQQQYLEILFVIGQGAGGEKIQEQGKDLREYKVEHEILPPWLLPQPLYPAETIQKR